MCVADEFHAPERTAWLQYAPDRPNDAELVAEEVEAPDEDSKRKACAGRDPRIAAGARLAQQRPAADRSDDQAAAATAPRPRGPPLA